MAIVFYYAPMSSASPVSCALAELKVPHERVTFNLAEGQQRSPEFLKLNPNGKVPTIVVDGTPMFEAVAIMQWLGERFGVAQGLWPATDAPARLEALSWSTWSYVTLGTVIVRLNYAQSPRVNSEFHNPPQAAQAHKDLHQLLQILDARLTRQPYMLGAAYSLVDLIVASVVNFGVICGMRLDGHARVQEWLARCLARPSFQQHEATAVSH